MIDFFYHMHVVERWILEHDGADDHDVYPVSGPPPLLLPLQKGKLASISVAKLSKAY